ncbi:MAG: hypothetical protein ABI772_00805 [Bacteroidota bacterium]
MENQKVNSDPPPLTPPQITVAQATALAASWYNYNIETLGLQPLQFPIAFLFNTPDVQNVLNQSGCVQVRFYLGYNGAPSDAVPNAQGPFQMFYVGVDSKGNDMVGTANIINDFAYPCPDTCSGMAFGSSSAE